MLRLPLRDLPQRQVDVLVAWFVLGFAGASLHRDPKSSMMRFFGLDQLTLNQRVPGSSPGAPTKSSIKSKSCRRARRNW